MEDMSIKIILRIGDEDIELTVDEAKKLFNILKDLFKEGKEEKTESEPYYYWPTRREEPMPFLPYPVNPYGYPIIMRYETPNITLGLLSRNSNFS